MRQLLSALLLALMLVAPAQAQMMGQSNVTPVNCSGTIATGGTAQNAIPTSGNRHGFIFQNLSTEVMWISWVGTAVASTPGSYMLPPASATEAGGSFVAPFGFGMNTALSVVSATTASAYSCTWY